VNLRDTIRYIYNNSYVYYKWQKSNVGGTIWNNMTGPGTSGIGSPALVNGLYQFIATLPPFLAYPADSGTYYRVILATTAANLANNCAYNDGSTTMVKVINCGTVLSAVFNQFRGQLVDKRSFLTWATNGEEGLLDYEIEKSLDGNSFYRIASVPARNIAESYYNFTDPDPVYENTYYRLKMNDNDGRFKYSSTILLSPQLKLELKAFNNPFKTEINTEVIIPENGGLQIQLINDKGQSVKLIQQQVRKGLNEIKMADINGNNGIYFLVITYRNETIRVKLLRMN
jgi:hypothetical protein